MQHSYIPFFVPFLVGINYILILYAVKFEYLIVFFTLLQHNYIPFFLEAARQLARKGKLQSIVETAKAKEKARVLEARTKRKKGDE